MIADHRLRYRQPQPRAVLLGGVIRSEQALALFRRQSRAGIGQFKKREPIVSAGHGTESQCAALGHGVNRVQHKIFYHSTKQYRIGAYLRHVAQLQLAAECVRDRD